MYGPTFIVIALKIAREFGCVEINIQLNGPQFQYGGGHFRSFKC